MIRADFTFWVGLVMDKFFDGTQEQKLIGTKCSKCGKIFLPPRNRCGDCFAKAEEFVNLPETGTLLNFTATPWTISERRSRKGKKDTLVGLVQVDETDSGFITEIINTTEDKLEEGMKLKIGNMICNRNLMKLSNSSSSSPSFTIIFISHSFNSLKS